MFFIDWEAYRSREQFVLGNEHVGSTEVYG